MAIIDITGTVDTAIDRLARAVAWAADCQATPGAIFSRRRP